MPKWFTPAAVICGLMFAVAPILIANAPYESTMGLVQKIFYVHLPSALDVPAGGDRLRRRERAVSCSAAIRARIGSPGRRRSSSCCSA